MKLPFDRKTIAGYVALSGEMQNLIDVYSLPPETTYSYNRAFDEASGYRCKSMLAVPMRNREGQVIGVIQLINKKRRPDVRLSDKSIVEDEVTMFDAFDEELVLSLGSQAGICLETAKLYEEIEVMFEGLVQSFTLALERRNRTTYGHCMRVAQYAIAIAQAVCDNPERFGGVTYTPDQMKELRYAALLHDIGKIAVPEAVLDKQNKLTDDQLKAVEYRFHYWKAKLAAQGAGAKAAIERLDKYLAHVRRTNIPLERIADEDVKLLDEIKSATFIDTDGKEKTLLSDLEHENLVIRRGNLTLRERKQIEQHIVDTWEMLKQVPWPKQFAKVANLAACHHEKINGSGYPWGFKAADIPLGGKILAIVDIFEALTAKDRPYKPAMPVEKAMAIVDDEVARGALDKDLWALFKEKKLHQLFAGESGFVGKPK
jgi:HD-GYP domain-containing protein (c-di-GMP phosphodiesterase class II)